MSRNQKTVRRILIAFISLIGISFLSVFLFYAFFFHRSPDSSESQEELYRDLTEMIPGGTVEPVSFLSGEKKLKGYFLHPEDADGVLVFALGRAAKIGDHLKEAEAFTDDGWNVLIYYGTGCGASEGDSMEGLFQGKKDLAAALSFLSADPAYSDECLVIYGHSCGAYAAAAVTDETGEIDGAVCVAGFETSPELMIAAAKSKVGPLAWLGVPFIYLFEHIRSGGDAFDSASDSLTASGTPVFLIQFQDDPAVPAEADLLTYMEKKKAPCAVSVRLGEPYANHHDSSVLAGSEILDSVLVFLDELRN